jgi:UDP-N-acetylglucosamine acyltransferase
MAIHSSAFVDGGARLGADVTVDPFAVIHGDAEIGDGCRIGSHTVIHPYTRIGARTHVHAGAVIGDVPQDLAFAPGTVSYTEIGADCVVREGVTVHRGTKPDSVTRIGERCFLMANSHFAHNCMIGNDVIVVSGALLAGYVEVQDRAFVSGNAVVHQFCRVGRLALVSGLAAVSQDVPPFCMLQTGGTNHLVGLNTVGMRRAGLSAEERTAIKQVFKLLFVEQRPREEAMALAAASYPEGAAAELWQFVQMSKRGVCRMLRRGKEE